jgi:hypothetical protein
MPHRETCCCDDPSALVTFNLRCERLLRDNESDFCRDHPLPDNLRARLSGHPMYQFGFREFMPAQHNQQLVAVFLAAIRPDWEKPEQAMMSTHKYQRWREEHRFFGIVVRMPDAEPLPFEYRIGDMFEIPNDVPQGEWLSDRLILDPMTDDELLAWLSKYRAALVDYVARTMGTDVEQSRAETEVST